MRGITGAVMPYNALVLLGPTASGKTALAVRLAHALNAEIISTDSRQVYRGLDIGSGKDLRDYIIRDADGKKVFIPYHLIDITDLTHEYNAFCFLRDAYAVFTDITVRGKLPLVVGGSGMYIDAFVRGYEFKEESERLTRPDIRPLILGISLPRALLHQNITQRLQDRFAEGMMAEVVALHENGASWERLERLGLEYRFIAEFLQNKHSGVSGRSENEDSLFRSLNHAINQFAKRQETWFRGMEKKGCIIHWIPHGRLEERLSNALKVIDEKFG
jgi:tRNA dimethylallyltransferase